MTLPVIRISKKFCSRLHFSCNLLFSLLLYGLDGIPKRNYTATGRCQAESIAARYILFVAARIYSGLNEEVTLEWAMDGMHHMFGRDRLSGDSSRQHFSKLMEVMHSAR